jgi:hypothetical protein
MLLVDVVQDARRSYERIAPVAFKGAVAAFRRGLTGVPTDTCVGLEIKDRPGTRAGMHQIESGFGAIAVNSRSGRRSEQRILLNQGV